MRLTTREFGTAVALGGALALFAASTAQADIRYADPAGIGPQATCPQADPCSIEDAIEGLPVADGDEILLAPGTYDLGGDDPLGIDEAITIRPADPATRPRIENTADGVFSIGDPGPTLSGFDIEAAGVASGVGIVHIQADGVTRLDRVTITSPALDGSQAIAVREGRLELTDSGIYVHGNGANAVEVYEIYPSVLDSVIRNSTLIAQGTGAVAIAATSPSPPLDHTLDVVNTILAGEPFAIETTNGTAGPPGGELTTSVRHSNLGAVSDPPGDNSSVSLGAGNQSEPPLLAAPAAGDFTQLAGSPTIDAGLDEGLSGPFDLLGGPRVLGTAIDIGADESQPPPVVSDTQAPATTITKGPKRKQKTKRKRAKARFEFGSTEAGSSFECALDGAAFRPCSSPHEVKVKAKRKAKRHEMLVRATDAAGNVDQTPAAHRWKLKRK